MKNNYDIIIVGGGPAGMAAGIYASRAGRSVLIIESDVIGGQASESYEIENYPGFENIAGPDLMKKMFEQTKKLGVEFLYSMVTDILPGKEQISVICLKEMITCKRVILAMGTQSRKLNLPNEKSYIGKGISYCAYCDGNFFKDKVVAVVGGGNTAFEDVTYLSKIAKHIYLIHRNDTFKADDILYDEVQELAKEKIVDIFTNTTIVDIKGNEVIDTITIKTNDKAQDLKVDGVFVAIGRKPFDQILKGIELDQFGFIKVNEEMQTNISNVYAAGDITSKKIKQIVTACSDGAVAGIYASKIKD